MVRADFDRIYARVPVAQKQLLREFRANHPYREVDINGTRWRYIACGQGDSALLFLPGGFLRADMWFHAVLALEKTYRIIAPDSFALQGTFDMDSVCDALLQILEAEGVEKATVIGLSAGGGLGQHLVQTHPERVEHLVLSHCGIIERSAEAEKSMSRMLGLVRLLPLFITQSILKRMTSGHLPPSSQWIEFHNAYFREAAFHTDKEMFVRFLQSGMKTRRRFVFQPEALESWPGEILLLSSEDDLARASLEKLQERFPRARTHVFEQGGHHTFMLFPEAYTAILKGFLDKVLAA